MQFLKAITRRRMGSPLCLAHIWFLTVVSSHLLNKHLRCSPSLLPGGILQVAILHKAVGCPAHWGCNDWLTSQEHQSSNTTWTLWNYTLRWRRDGRVCQKWAELTNKGGFHSALSLFQLHFIWIAGVWQQTPEQNWVKQLRELPATATSCYSSDKLSTFYLPQLQDGKMS